MRNITVFAVLVITVFLTQLLPAQEKLNKTHAFSLSPTFGMIYGRAEEIVYPDNNKYKGEYLSQLLWDMKPVFYYGLSLDFSRIEPLEKWGFFSNLSLKCGIPGLSGKMEDRDWLSFENANLTNFSKHDNTSKKLLILDFSAGVSFPLRHGFLLKSLAGVSYKRFSFSGSGGYLEYARKIGGNIYAPIDNDPLIIKIPGGEKVINYTQDWLVFTPGTSLRYYIVQHFFTEISFQISPLILCADMDEHLFFHDTDGRLLGRNEQFRDYTRGGLYLEPGFRVSYAAGKRLEISLTGSWQGIWGSKGQAYMRPIGEGDYAKAGEAGTGLQLLDMGLSVKIRI